MSEKFSAIFNQIPGALLETSRFGRSEKAAYWINSKSLLGSAKLLSQEGGMVCLENLSCIQVDQSLVLTYFLRSALSEVEQETGILRVSFDLPEMMLVGHSHEGAFVAAPSVSEVWPIAEEFEREISKLFGVQFSREDGKAARTSVAPEASWNGFPLRKDFVFPSAERDGGFR